jgi:hypothetical protein
MDWIRAALRHDKKDKVDLSIEELQEAIDATRIELQRVQRLGEATRQRRKIQIQQLQEEKRLKDRDLIAVARVAKSFTPFWEYAQIVRSSFKESGLNHTWYGLCEAWLLRLIHHAMMFKKQLDIVQKDCNGMLMDLYQTIPEIKEEKSLGEAVAMSNLCKMEHSSKDSKEQYQQYMGLQRKIICKLKMRTREEESENRRRRFSLPGPDAVEPTNFEEVVAMAKQEMDEAAKAKAKEEEYDSDELQVRRKRRDKRTKTSDLSSLPKGSAHSNRERRNSLGDDSFMASSAKLSLVDSDEDEKSTAKKDIKAKAAKKEIETEKITTTKNTSRDRSPTGPRRQRSNNRLHAGPSSPRHQKSSDSMPAAISSPRRQRSTDKLPTAPTSPRRQRSTDKMSSATASPRRRASSGSRRGASNTLLSPTARRPSLSKITLDSKKMVGPTARRPSLSNSFSSGLDAKKHLVSPTARRPLLSKISSPRTGGSAESSASAKKFVKLSARRPSLSKVSSSRTGGSDGSGSTEKSRTSWTRNSDPPRPMTEAAQKPETSSHSASSTSSTTNQALRSAMRMGMRNSLVKSANQRRVSVVEESSPNTTLLSKTATSTSTYRPAVTKRPSFKRPTLKKSRSQRQKAVDRLTESKRKSSEIKQMEEEGSSDLGGDGSTIPEIASTVKQKSPTNTTLVTAQ